MANEKNYNLQILEKKHKKCFSTLVFYVTMKTATEEQLCFCYAITL